MPPKKEPKPSFNSVKVEKSLRFKFPDSHIVFNPELNPTEAICEVEPTADHPDHSVAVAVLGKSKPHHHEQATETYEVLSGKIKLHLGEKAVSMYRGMSETIKPGTVHWAEAVEDGMAWVRVTSEPGWTPEDHILESEQ